MFVDPGIGLFVAQRINRWLRRRRRPRGIPDPYYRGIRLQYNPTYRLVMALVSALLLAMACVLYLVPDLFEDKGRWAAILVKAGWIIIAALAVLAPLQAFREFVVVSDEGLLKSSLFGVETRLNWGEIARVRAKPGENDITFETGSGGRLKMSLCYDGWADFCEFSRRRLAPRLSFALAAALADEPSRRRKNH